MPEKHSFLKIKKSAQFWTKMQKKCRLQMEKYA